MVTKRDDDDDRPTTDRGNIGQSATGRLEGRVLQNREVHKCFRPVLLRGLEELKSGDGFHSW